MTQRMVKETNWNEVRRLTKALFDEAPPVNLENGGRINHPFSLIAMGCIQTPTGAMKSYNLCEPEEYAAWKAEVCAIIDSPKTSAMDLTFAVTDAWKNYWMATIFPYLAKEDLTEILQAAWMSFDMPSVSTGMNLSTLILYFKCMDKKKFMEPDEYNVFKNLPEEITLYRGYNMRYKRGLSWTDDINVAAYFAKRDGFSREVPNGRIVSVTVPKELCLAYFVDIGSPTYILDMEEVEKRGISLKYVKNGKK